MTTTKRGQFAFMKSESTPACMTSNSHNKTKLPQSFSLQCTNHRPRSSPSTVLYSSFTTDGDAFLTRPFAVHNRCPDKSTASVQTNPGLQAGCAAKESRLSALQAISIRGRTPFRDWQWRRRVCVPRISSLTDQILPHGIGSRRPFATIPSSRVRLRIVHVPYVNP